MATVNNIVVATDFSDIADKALASAADLARQLGASLHVLHIVQIHPTNMPESGNVNIEELEALEEKSAADSLKSTIDTLAADVDVSTYIVHGDPATQVNQLAADKNADLIVIGTHGRSGISRLIMGSVAESVLKQSDIPVMCVKGA